MMCGKGYTQPAYALALTGADHVQTKALAALAALAFLSSFSGARAALPNGDGSEYWQRSRDQLRATCAQLLGRIVESQSKTRCYVEQRNALYICKDSGLCQTQAWNPRDSDAPSSHGGSGSSLSESSDGGAADDEVTDDGPIIIL